MSTRPTRPASLEHAAPRRRSRRVGIPTVLLLLGIASCDLGSSGNELARAGDLSFSVEEAAALMENRGDLPNNEEIVRAVAELWVSYALLAQAVHQDSTLQSVDISPIIDAETEQSMIVRFRDSVVEPDTVFTEEELQSEFERLGAGAEIQARHILLTLPETATDAQRDSVLSLAEDLARRARDGADFAELAREYSQDPGSASGGGDLGAFGRGEMVPAFEEAAFALEPGEVSDAVETPFGFHVIRLESRTAPDFEPNRDRFTEELRARRTYQAESVFVTGIEESANLEIQGDAHSILRELATSPEVALNEDESDRPLVTYDGGDLTAGEVQTFLRARAPQERAQVEQGQAEQLDMILSNLARRELLLTEARGAGFDVSEATRDSMRANVRDGLGNAARSFGLVGITPAEGESEDEAIERAVATLLVETLQGRRNVLPLGPLTYGLQEEFGATIDDSAIPRVVEEVRTRESATAPPEPDENAGTP